MMWAFSESRRRPCEVEPARLEAIQLLLQDLEVQHHAVADHQETAGVQGAAGHLMQGDALAIHHHGVPGVVATLEADHLAEVGAEQIHDLALALVPPLEAQDRKIGPSQAHVALQAFQDNARLRICPGWIGTGPGQGWRKALPW